MGRHTIGKKMENKFGSGMFMGNDEEYGGYAHKYDEPDTDRGASDEGWEYKTDQYNPYYSPNGEAIRRFRMKGKKW